MPGLPLSGRPLALVVACLDARTALRLALLSAAARRDVRDARPPLDLRGASSCRWGQGGQ